MFLIPGEVLALISKMQKLSENTLNHKLYVTFSPSIQFHLVTNLVMNSAFTNDYEFVRKLGKGYCGDE